MVQIHIFRHENRVNRSLIVWSINSFAPNGINKLIFHCPTWWVNENETVLRSQVWNNRHRILCNAYGIIEIVFVQFPCSEKTIMRSPAVGYTVIACCDLWLERKWLWGKWCVLQNVYKFHALFWKIQDFHETILLLHQRKETILTICVCFFIYLDCNTCMYLPIRFTWTSLLNETRGPFICSDVCERCAVFGCAFDAVPSMAICYRFGDVLLRLKMVMNNDNNNNNKALTSISICVMRSRKSFI